MSHTGYLVGDRVWYELDFRRDRNTCVVTAHLVAAEVIAIGSKRVSIKLVDFPEYRVRSVTPNKIWF